MSAFRLTRRQFAALAAVPSLARGQQPVEDSAALFEAALKHSREARLALRKLKVPRATEPAFSFSAQ